MKLEQSLNASSEISVTLYVKFSFGFHTDSGIAKSTFVVGFCPTFTLTPVKSSVVLYINE